MTGMAKQPPSLGLERDNPSLSLTHTHASARAVRQRRYEEDVRVPFLMAGPGVPRGVYVPEVAAAMTDLTATIAHLAGAWPPAGSRDVWIAGRDGERACVDKAMVAGAHAQSPIAGQLIM